MAAETMTGAMHTLQSKNKKIEWLKRLAGASKAPQVSI